MTPDGVRYLASAHQRVARPFHYRWMVPKLCGDDLRRWTWVTNGSLYALLVAVWWYIGGWRGVAAAVALTGLTGIWKFNRANPVLIDAPALMLAVVAADCMRHGLWFVAIPVAVLSGCVSEKSPIFAAIFAWNPVLLIGMVSVGIRHLQHEGPDVLDEEARWILDHPFKASRKYHKGFPTAIWVFPWGGAIIALANQSPQLAVTLALAYGQCLVATDTVRLYQWAAPVVLLAAVTIIPLAWLPVFAVLTWANPFAGTGL